MGSRRTWRSASWRPPREDPGRGRSRVHRLRLRPPSPRGTSGRRGSRARQAHLCRAHGEPGGSVTRPGGAGGGRHRRRRHGVRRRGGVRRDRQLRRGVPRGPLDPLAWRVHPDRRLRRLRVARGRTGEGHPPSTGLDRRGVRVDPLGLVHRGLDPSTLVSLLRLQGGWRSDRPRLPPHLWRGRARRPRFEQLRTAAASREAHPAPILNAAAGQPDPLLGDRLPVRNWIFVDDFCAAIDVVLERGQAGEVYNAGGPDELRNIDVVKAILELTGRDESLIQQVSDRLGHDRRYSLSSDRLRELGWEPEVRFDAGLARTVDWYRENERWWGPIRSGEYRDYYERQYGRALS